MFKTILNTLGTKIISLLMGFLILILTTQYLGADGRGLVSLLGTSVGLILIFSGFIGGSSLVYLASRHDISYLLIPSYFWAVIIAVTGTITLAVFHVIPDSIILPTFILSTLSGIGNVNLMILIGKEKITLNNTISLVQVITNFLTLIFFFLVYNQPSVSYYIYSMYITNIIAIFLGFYGIRKYFNGFSTDFIKAWTVVKSMLNYGFFGQIGNVIQYLNYRVSYFILNVYSGIGAVGIYSVGVTLSETVWLISGSIALVEYSKISNIRDEDYAKKLTIKLSKVSFFATLSVVISLLCVPADWFALIFGKDFSTVYGVILTMSAGICSFGLTVIISHFFAGIGKFQINAIAAGIGLIGTVTFSYLLIPSYGYIGAGITASISYLMTSLFLIWIFIRQTQISIKDLYPTMNDLTEVIFELRKIFSFKNKQ